MIAVGFLSVFVITLFVSYCLVKVVPVVRRIKKWRTLDDRFPQPPGHWLWGSIHKLRSYMELLNKTQPYLDDGAKAYVLWIGFYRAVVVVGHPETMKAILRTSEPKAKSGGGYSFIVSWLGDGLLVSDGKKWERNRRLLTPAFHFDILHPYVKIYNQVVEKLMDKIAKKSKNEEFVEVFTPVGLATLDTMLQCALSYKDDIQEKGEHHPYVKSVIRLAQLLIKRTLNIFVYIPFIYNMTKDGKEWKQLCDYTHQFSSKIISARQKSLETDPDQLKKRHLDFLDILLTAHDENGEGLTSKEIRDEVDTFMFEGHDTTSSAISWIMYALAKYPEEQENVLDDVLQAMEDKENMEWEDLAKLKYLPMFIRECMRLYPPVPVVSRELSQPLEVDGVKVPKGVIIDIGIYQMNYNANVWPEPLEFRPERFHPDNFAGSDPYCYVPFSAGPRNCIGQNFALNEIKVMISRIVKRFKIDLDPERPPEPLAEIVLRAKDGLYLKFTPRSEA